jgi:hypothetical protein
MPGLTPYIAGFKTQPMRRNFPRSQLYTRRNGRKRRLRTQKRGKSPFGNQYISACRTNLALERSDRHWLTVWASTPSSSPIWALPITLQKTNPDLRLHLSVQAGASSPEAINFYCRGIWCQTRGVAAYLDRRRNQSHSQRNSLRDRSLYFRKHWHDGGGPLQPEQLCHGDFNQPWTGFVPRRTKVKYEEDSQHNLTTKLGEFTIDRFACGENAGYPTICKGRYCSPARKDGYYAFEEPISLNLTSLLPALIDAGGYGAKDRGTGKDRKPMCRLSSRLFAGPSMPTYPGATQKYKTCWR